MTQLSITGPKGNFSFDGQVNRLTDPNNLSYSGQITNNKTGTTRTVDATRIKNPDGTISKTGTITTKTGEIMSFNLVKDLVAQNVSGSITQDNGTTTPINRPIGFGTVTGSFTNDGGTVIPINKTIGIG
ncbi:MAG: hypothetical protein ACK481_09425 [Candidatus Melainabacteria bacterium]|jgi:hypothetical protein